MYKTNLGLSSMSFTDQDILKIIKMLHVSKAHGYDDISKGCLKFVTQK